MEIVPLGDSALIIRVVADFARDPEASLNTVLAALRSLEAAAIPGVIELAPAYSTVALFFDATVIAHAAPEQNPFDWLGTRIERVLKNRSSKREKRMKAPLFEIPVCYDREFALDLDDVVRSAGLAAAKVIRLHSDRKSTRLNSSH